MLARKLDMRLPVLLALLLVGCERDDPPKGEGSYRAADRITRELAAIKVAGSAAPLPVGYHRFTYDDGSWYVATGTNSHDGADGGTVGILTSDGDQGIFFTHVCGKGEMPVTFFEKSPKQVIENLRRAGKEFKSQQSAAGR